MRVEYAGFWRRAIALIIDSAILCVVFVVVGFLFSATGVINPAKLSSAYEINSSTNLLANIIATIIAILYTCWFHSSGYQATIGKQLMGCYVVDKNGQRISFGRALLRYFSAILSAIFAIGFLMAAFTKKKTALHDLIAGTYVIKN